MIESLLVRTLRLLSQEEIETLHLFVASPLFNEVRPKETMDLFEYIKPYFPEFNDQKLLRESAAGHFFQNHQNPDAELQRTMAQLLNIIRQFVAFKSTSITKNKPGKRKQDESAYSDTSRLLNESRQKLAMLRFYSERMHQNQTIQTTTNPEKNLATGKKNRNPENLFHNMYKELKKNLLEINQLTDVNEHAFGDLYYFRFLLEQEKALYESLYNQRDSDYNLLQTIEELDQYYMVSKLDLMCRMLHAQRMSALYSNDSDEIRRLNVNKKMTQSMVETMLAQNYLQTPLVHLYSLSLDLLLEDNPEAAELKFDTVLSYLEMHQSMLPATRINDIKAIWRSFWPSRYRETKNKRFLERLFQMLLEQTQQLPEGELMFASPFLNIISAALRLDKTSWAESFFNQYHNRLNGLQNSNWVVKICKALILLAQNKAPEAASELGHYFSYGDIDDIYIYSIAATLDVRIRYALDDLDSEECERLTHTASTRIRRDALLPEHRKKERLRFFSLARGLYRIKVRRDLDKRADVSKDLAVWKNKMDESPVVDWEWLEEKFAEL